MGAAAIAPTVLLAQEGNGTSISDVCLKPKYAEQSATLWSQVRKVDKTEVQIAILGPAGPRR